jgi:hypothetical protein
MEERIEILEFDKKYLMVAQENEFSKGFISVCENLYPIIVKIDDDIKKIKKYQKEGFKFMSNDQKS